MYGHVMDVGGLAPKFHKRRGFFKTLGPGLITGASDDDPSGIGTYSQAGAQLGFSVGWTMLLTYPLMVAIQEICARIGRVTGHGLAGNVCRYLSAPVLAIFASAVHSEHGEYRGRSCRDGRCAQAFDRRPAVHLRRWSSVSSRSRRKSCSITHVTSPFLNG